MTEFDPILINMPCPTKDEAEKLCREMLATDLCGTARVTSNVHLMYKHEGEEVGEEDVVLMTLKTTQKNLKPITEYIFKNHTWSTPCIEVLPILTDMC